MVVATALAMIAERSHRTDDVNGDLSQAVTALSIQAQALRESIISRTLLNGPIIFSSAASSIAASVTAFGLSALTLKGKP